MSTTDTLERMLTSYLEEGPLDLPVEQRAAIARATEEIAQRGAGMDWRGLAGSHRLRAALAAGLLVIAGVMVVPRAGPGSVAGPNATPTPSSTALTWTPDAPGQPRPYPAPLREEPSGGGPVFETRAWTDTTGDGLPTADIVNVEFARELGCYLDMRGMLCVHYKPAQLLQSPLPDPLQEWIAYGMVMDKDRDGRPDGRFGIDNGRAGAIRAWYTNFETGATLKVTGGNGLAYDLGGVAELPFSTTRMLEGFIDLIQGWTASPPQWNGGFYLWAAVIRDGRVVSLDFAPDAGWLVAFP